MPETTPLIKAALNLRVGAEFDVYLCIAKELVEMHKGKIELSDTLGGGCTFKISLPF